jgi:hypothetical protein
MIADCSYTTTPTDADARPDTDPPVVWLTQRQVMELQHIRKQREDTVLGHGFIYGLLAGGLLGVGTTLLVQAVS